jgi:hypothetical protein
MTSEEEYLMQFLEDFAEALKGPEWKAKILEGWQIVPRRSEAPETHGVVAKSYSREESMELKHERDTTEDDGRLESAQQIKSYATPIPPSV